MASTIKLKNGSGAPTTGDLVQGEPALDLTNKRLYTENASGVVIEVGTNPSTIDINAGTIDGTVIGGSTAAAITGTTITGTSFVSSGDMTFEDNDKAVFGDGSDLRIYHTGSHSTIENIGTGHLQIHTTDFRLRNSAGTESMILANADGNVQLFYDNAEKLATTATGIDVTGTVTADGLTSDGNVSVVGAGNTRTIGFDFYGSPKYNFHVDGATDADKMFIRRGTTNVANFASNGDLSLYEDTGTTAKFFWDASEERLGIGTTSPSVHLDVEGTAQVNLLEVTHDGDRAVNFVRTGANTFSIEHDITQFYFWNQTTSESPLLFQNDGDVIMNGGNVGIGTSSPAYKAQISDSGNTVLSVTSGDSSSASLYLGDSVATRGRLTYDNSSDSLAVYTDNNERMRLDSAGNLLVGQTSADSNSVGIGLLSNGTAYAVRDGGAAFIAHRKSSDGNIVEFLKDNTTVGSIGTKTGNPFIANANTGIKFTNEVEPCDNNGADADTFVDLGSASNRFGNLYLSGSAYTPVVQGLGDEAGLTFGGALVAPRKNNAAANGTVDLGASSARFKDLYLSAAVRWYVSGVQKAYMQYDGTDVVHYGASGVGHQFWSGGYRSVDIDSSGNLLVGTTTNLIWNTTNLTGCVIGGNSSSGGFSSIQVSRVSDLCLLLNRLTSDGQIQAFARQGTQVGEITVTTSSTSYNTSSDYRLKENIADADDAGSKIDAIKVRKFDWKADGSHQDYGMVAQELMTVAPEAVSVPEDPEKMMGVDYSKLVPMLIKEVQSLRARVAQLEGAN
jgi:hypothetical protein